MVNLKEPDWEKCVNIRLYSKYCIIFWSIKAAGWRTKWCLWALFYRINHAECCTHAVEADFWIFHCWSRVAQLKCEWKQGVITRNILSGCGRGARQSSSITYLFFSSPVFFQRICLCFVEFSLWYREQLGVDSLQKLLSRGNWCPCVGGADLLWVNMCHLKLN